MSATKKKVALSVDKQELAARLFVKLYGAGNGRTPEHYAQQAFDAAGVFLQTYEASQVAEREAEEAKAREEAEAAEAAESPLADTSGDAGVSVEESRTSG